jgi:hypothetical protein
LCVFFLEEHFGSHLLLPFTHYLFIFRRRIYRCYIIRLSGFRANRRGTCWCWEHSRVAGVSARTLCFLQAAARHGDGVEARQDAAEATATACMRVDDAAFPRGRSARSLHCTTGRTLDGTQKQTWRWGHTPASALVHTTLARMAWLSQISVMARFG